MFRTCTLTILGLAATATTAIAESTDDGLDSLLREGREAETSPPLAPTAEAPADAAGEAQWGLGTTWPTGGDGAYANLLKAMAGGNWLELGASLRINKVQLDPLAEAETVIGLGARAGYRMYRTPSGRVRPYLMPYGGLDFGNLDEAGDTLTLTFGAAFGVDLQVIEQFTLGLRVGLGATFADDFDTVSITTGTSGINAAFWW